MRKYVGGIPYSTDKRKLDEYYNNLTLVQTNSYRDMSLLAIRHLRWRQFMNLVIPGFNEFNDPNLR